MSAKPIVVSPATTSAMVMPTLSTTRSTSSEVLGADLLGFGPQDLVGIIDDLRRSASAGGGSAEWVEMREPPQRLAEAGRRIAGAWDRAISSKVAFFRRAAAFRPSGADTGAPTS